MSDSIQEICFLCGDQCQTQERGGLIFFKCEHCDEYYISQELFEDVKDQHTHPLRFNNDLMSALKHHLFLLGREGFQRIINQQLVDRFIENPWLPSIADQRENFVRLLGDTSRGLGTEVHVIHKNYQSKVGCYRAEGIPMIARHLHGRGLISMQDASSFAEGYLIVKLTFDGWILYEEIKAGKSTGKKVFMAMPFNKPDLDSTWLPVVREAVKATGFDLRRADDYPKPGIIDVRMRVEIKESRFVIVDLTHENLGAYWEAGYAEGLGKPVIYTCRVGEPIHFDAAHLTRVVWAEDKLDLASQQLKAMIRNELPDAVPDLN